MLAIRNFAGIHYFTEKNPHPIKMFANDTEISVGKGSSFLVFKDSNLPYLQIMPACDNDARFDPSKFSCIRCIEG